MRSGSRRRMWAKSGWREVNEESSVMMLKFRQGYWLDPVRKVGCKAGSAPGRLGIWGEGAGGAELGAQAPVQAGDEVAEGLVDGEKELCDGGKGSRGATCKSLPARLGRKHGAVRSSWWGCPGHCLFLSQGDRRDEEEETQMKKSESEVEVRVGGQGS